MNATSIDDRASRKEVQWNFGIRNAPVKDNPLSRTSIDDVVAFLRKKAVNEVIISLIVDHALREGWNPGSLRVQLQSFDPNADDIHEYLGLGPYKGKGTDCTRY